MKNSKEKCPVCDKPFHYRVFSGKVDKQCDHNFRVRPKVWTMVMLLFLLIVIQSLAETQTTPENIADGFGEKIGGMFAVVIMALAIYLVIIKIVGFDRSYKVINNEKDTL